ncbi:wax ester/triacylglycerol synthase family O-acyltransferase [Congregibacter sp.]|uniref:wax ester/triacylglycerol synthase family O-acyltransferase n=1 Tax=Congregibacter sp. TaxID=2744308 RepID=UPI00385D8FB2
MHQLSPQDAQFLYAETEHNLTHVTSVAIYDPSTVPGGETVRFTDIIAHVRERLAYNPVFFRRLLRLPLEIDYPYWVEDEYFDLEYHMQHGRLPEPGDWRQFCIHMARYHSRPLDMNRPPWEIFVVEGLDHVKGLPKGCYALATKIHHAAVDGASLMKFFASMADGDNLGTPLVPLESVDVGSGEIPAMPALISQAFKNNLRSPLRVAETVMRAAPGLVQAAQDSIAKRESSDKHPVPPTRFNVDLSPHKMFDARVVPLDDLKRIRQLHPGVTINDVVLAICSGALRRYLSHHDELPEESIIAWVPINARPRGADGKDLPGNNISAMTTPIFTNEENPVERLRLIRKSTQASKEARSGVSARLMTDITRHVPAATQVLASRLLLRSGAAARMCNLFISNVPGPQIPMYMNGARMVRSVGLAPLADGMGLFIGTPSYDGEMSFSVISTRELLPDIEFFMDCLEASVAELLALADAAAKPEKRAKAKAKAKTKTKAKARPKASPKARSKAAAKKRPTAKKSPATKRAPSAK